MKETIYTIPIQEAFESTQEQDTECPICRLRLQLEVDSLDYVLGAAMMEPDIRMETNRLGFCPNHLDKMLRAQKKLPLALVLQTRLETLLSKPESLREHSCFLCERTDHFFSKYISNILHMWSVHPEFRTRFEQTQGICFPHIAALSAQAKKDMSKKEYLVFSKVTQRLTTQYAQSLYTSVSAFCKSFDHRFAGMDLGADKDAVERCVHAMQGETLQ
jgi:hypothetical protein